MSDTFLPTTRARRSSGFVRSMLFSAARGAALIGLAVVIGVVLLQVVDTGKGGGGGEGGGGSAGGTTTTTTTAAGSSTTTTATGSSTTKAPTGPVKQPGQLTVEVLNGSGKVGAAGALSGELAKKGYQMGKPTDAPKLRTGTAVSCTAGLDREATALAAAVGSAAKVEPFPSPVPPGAEKANCIVIVGS